MVPRVHRLDIQGLRATYVDTADLACLEQQCTAVAAGRMVYVDKEHLSRTWVRRVTPHVRVRMGIA